MKNTHIDENEVRKIVQQVISEEFELNSPSPITKQVISIISMFGKPSARGMLSILPVSLSITITGLMLSANWYFNIRSLETSYTNKLVESILPIDTRSTLNKSAICDTHKKVANIVGLLNSYPDGYFIETIDLSSKLGSILYLPVHKEYLVSMKIYPRGLDKQQIELLQDQKALHFKINGREVFDDNLQQAGWSSAHRFFEKETPIPTISKKDKESVFAEGLSQTIQFRIDTNSSKYELYRNTKFSVLFILHRPFDTEPSNPDGPDSDGTKVSLSCDVAS